MPEKSLIAAPEIQEIKPLVSDISRMTEVDNWLGLTTEDILPNGYVIQKEKPKLTQRPLRLLQNLSINLFKTQTLQMI